MDQNLRAKLERLQELLRALERVAVAFSGGADSAFLLKAAVDTLGAANVLAVTGRSPSVPAADLEEASRLAKSLGVVHLLVDPGEFEDANYLANPINRCYFCKNALYGRMRALLAGRGGATIVSGTNADDHGDYRPGLAAAREHGVREPCAEAGLTKKDIRTLSAEMGLHTSVKPASPCLASRVPYGEPITAEKMSLIDQAESKVREVMSGLAGPGTTLDCRVRIHGTVARIEVPPDQIERLAAAATREQLDTALRALGFQYVSVDLRGFRSGSLNEAITLGKPQPS